MTPISNCCCIEVRKDDLKRLATAKQTRSDLNSLARGIHPTGTAAAFGSSGKRTQTFFSS
eukprot:6201402-Pleurochrysis_carterae.AAC.4